MSENTVDTVDTDPIVDEAPAEVEAPIEGAEALGDAGKQALDRMKAERNAERTRARELQAERDALKAQIEGREAEYTAEQERQRTKDEALAAANKRIASAQLKLEAKGKLADPADVSLYINVEDFEVSDDGDVDADALRTAIDELLARKPHLAADSRRFDGAADQGAKASPRTSQLTAADLDSMSPAEINQARRDGRLNKVLGIN